MNEQPKICLISSDIKQPSPCGIYGHIESVSIAGIAGWLIDLEDKSATLTAYVNGIPVAEGALSQWRQDVADILGKPRSYGFLLDWQIQKIKELDFNVQATYPLLFSFNNNFFVFANLPKISGEIFSQILQSISVYEKQIQPEDLREDFIQALDKEEPRFREESDVKIIAYYLPQFYPIPENDAWWGPGFTEWVNVSTARPYFSGHEQPQLPGELGFYDLRLAETRKAQAELAREYGIYGFCYYYYWFNGRKLLNRPLEEVLASGEPDFPFCICWANESWSRRWNGSEKDVLIKQEHDKESDLRFIDEVMPILSDPRYIRLGGAPILLVYRASIMPDIRETAEAWRKKCRAHGIDKLYLCTVDSFEPVPPHEIGFDAAAQFPPHQTNPKRITNEIKDLDREFNGNVFDYADVVKRELAKPQSAHKRFPGVMTAWDNSARKGVNADIYHGATPELYEIWLRAAIERARASLPEGERLVFVNAWNEWAEGAHLEPDRKNGRKWLEATRRAATRQSDWQQLLQYAENVSALSGEEKENLLSDLRGHFTRLQFLLDWHEQLFRTGAQARDVSRMNPGLPAWTKSTPLAKNGQVFIDQVGIIKDPALVPVNREENMFCSGWGFAQNVISRPNTPSYLIFLGYDDDAILYHGFISRRLERQDIIRLYAKHDVEYVKFSGFRQMFNIHNVEKGSYRLGLLTRGGGEAIYAIGNVIVEVE